MSDRAKQLDVLRCIGVFLVLGRHFSLVPSQTPVVIRFVLSFWQSVGWMGVDLFFVLSGFLVSSLIFGELDKTAKFNAGRFFLRRGLKIYPSYYIFLAVTWLAILYEGKQYPPFTFLAQAMFVQNYYPGDGRYPIEPTWSLCVEEHFYFFLACSFALLQNKINGQKTFLGMCIFGILMVPLLRVGSVLDGHGPQNHLTHMRFDALLWGVVLSYIYHHHKTRVTDLAKTWRSTLPCLSLLLLLPCVVNGFHGLWMYSIGLIAEQIAFCLIILHMLANVQIKGRIGRLFASIGLYSYSIYLWHAPIAKICKLLPLPLDWYLASTTIYLLASILGGVILSKIIERPFLGLRDRLIPSVSGDPLGVTLVAAPATLR